MKTCMRFILSSIFSLILASAALTADITEKVYHYHEKVEDEVWEKISAYILPEKSVLKNKLDKIFKKFRVIHDCASMERAGFNACIPQKWTHLVVTSHPSCPGYIFKMYTDKRHHHKGTPDHIFWLKRCEGAQLIRGEIEQHGWGNWFKVPKKWIYPLPKKPKPTAKKNAKYFILVEEDMNIFSDEECDLLWKSEIITKEKLDALFYIIKKHGFWDCAKPANIPISKDLRIAFVDTQSFQVWPVAYHKLLKVLTGPLREYWRTITETPYP